MDTLSPLKTFVILSLLLMVMAGCAPQETVRPPAEPSYSMVLTQDGVGFYVLNLRIPGTTQELRLKMAGTTIWIPLSTVYQIRFSGPLMDQYRPGTVVLVSGEKLRGDLFVDFLLEGTTDQGYWNMPMKRIVAVDLPIE